MMRGARKGTLCHGECFLIKPILDFIKCRRIVESSGSTIVKPDAYETPSNKAVVVAIGDDIVRGGVVFPLSKYVSVGDTVLISQYGAEEIDEDGEKLVLVRLQDVKGIDRD